MDAIILSVGSELTGGQIVDTNAAWLSQQLAEIGIPVQMHITVADQLDSIVREIKQACGQADVIIVTGGLGPTEDDLMRKALAQVMGVQLELREEFVERLRDFFTSRNLQMPEANIVQAKFPAGSEPIENTCGTAPGIYVKIQEAMLFALPGVPREMRTMYERNVRPRLTEHTGGEVILTAILHCIGAGESNIAEKIRDLMQPGQNPSVGTTAKQGIISVRIWAQGATRQQAQTSLDKVSQEIRQRLGTLIFGENDQTLASAVAELLNREQKTIATAESCTGGLMAKSLTDISGSSAYFLQGFVTYSNEAKMRLLDVPGRLINQHGAVSAPVAEAMANSCRELSDSDYAISVTGIAGPTAGTAEKPVGLVYIGLADRQGCEVTEHRLGQYLSREAIRDRACKTALNRLRMQLIKNTER